MEKVLKDFNMPGICVGIVVTSLLCPHLLGRHAVDFVSHITAESQVREWVQKGWPNQRSSNDLNGRGMPRLFAFGSPPPRATQAERQQHHPIMGNTNKPCRNCGTSVLRLLEQDTFRNLVTLKMFNAYAASMTFDLRQDGDDWALLSLLPVHVSEWDRKTYPRCQCVAFINGNNDGKKLELLECLPKGDLVVKTADKVVQEALARTRSAKKVLAFHSFTRSAGLSLQQATRGADFSPLQQSALANPGPKQAEACAPFQSHAHDERAWAMFRANGYEDSELERHFKNCAQWFGIERAGELASACFVFQNYKHIWEIAGVYTQPAFRRQGLARANVLAALKYLADSTLVARYQARSDNAPSLELARACGLEEFLRMEHFVVGDGQERRKENGEGRSSGPVLT